MKTPRNHKTHMAVGHAPRTRWLARLRALLPLLCLIPCGAHAYSGEAVVLLYKAADIASAQRTDEGVDTATRILETALESNGYKVTQPDAAIQAILDKGPQALVTFAADAGLSIILSAKRRELPIPGDASRTQAEVALNARVYCGSVLQPSPPEALGKITALRTSIGKGYEVAAKRAATRLAENLGADLGRRETACEGALDRMIRDHRGGKSDTAPAPTGPLPLPKRVWALLVGVSDFQAARTRSGWKIGDLNGVRADLDLMQRSLLERGIPKENIILLQDKTASTSNFRQQLRTLQIKAEPDDLILVYLSSHGKAADIREATPERPSLSGYGLPIFHDFDPKDANTILDFWEIQSLLLNSRAQQVVWMVDTCHAGGATLGLQTESSRTAPGAVADKAKVERVQLSARGLQVIDDASDVFDPQQVAHSAGQIASNRNFIVLSAATPSQLALEAGNGLFTANLAQGLKQSKTPIAIEQLFRDHVELQVQEAALKLHHEQKPLLGKSGRGGEIRL